MGKRGRHCKERYSPYVTSSRSRASSDDRNTSSSSADIDSSVLHTNQDGSPLLNRQDNCFPRVDGQNRASSQEDMGLSLDHGKLVNLDQDNSTYSGLQNGSIAERDLSPSNATGHETEQVSGQGEAMGMASNLTKECRDLSASLVGITSSRLAVNPRQEMKPQVNINTESGFDLELESTSADMSSRLAVKPESNTANESGFEDQDTSSEIISPGRDISLREAMNLKEVNIKCDISPVPTHRHQQETASFEHYGSPKHQTIPSPESVRNIQQNSSSTQIISPEYMNYFSSTYCTQAAQLVAIYQYSLLASPVPYGLGLSPGFLSSTPLGLHSSSPVANSLDPYACTGFGNSCSSSIAASPFDSSTSFGSGSSQSSSSVGHPLDPYSGIATGASLPNSGTG